MKLSATAFLRRRRRPRQLAPRPLRWLAAAVLLLGVAACQEDVGTSVRVSLVYKDTWRMASADVIIAQDEIKLESNAPISHELLLLLPDSFAGTVMPFEVWGVRDDQRISHGSALALVRKGETVDATIVLDRLPCGVFCEPGEVQCEAGGVATCQEDADGCLEWSEPEQCPASAPFCSGGECRLDCADECVATEGTCVDTDTQRRCGEFDNDVCLDFGPDVDCAASEVCYSGRCAAPCAHGALTNSVTLDSTGAFAPAVAVDKAGNVHAVHSASDTRQIRYATRAKSGAWPATWQDIPGMLGENPSIVVDRAGGIHVLSGYNAVIYAHLPAGSTTWQTTTLETGTNIGISSSLAIADDGSVHAAYYRTSDQMLRYGKKGTPWTLVDVEPLIGLRCDLTMVGTVPHIVSFNAAGNVWYSTIDDGSWVSDQLVVLFAGTLLATASISIVADRDGTLHVAYSDLYPRNDDLRYIYRPSGGSWTNPIIIDATNNKATGAYPDLAIDPFDRLHVTYRHTEAPLTLRYATKEEGSTAWSLAVQPTMTSGVTPSIAIDSLANVHILSAVPFGPVVETQRTCN